MLKNLPETYKYNTFETVLGLYIRVRANILIITIVLFGQKLSQI